MELTVRTGQSLKQRIKGYFGCNGRLLLKRTIIATILLIAICMFATFCRTKGGVELPDDHGAVMEFVRAEVSFICTGVNGDIIKDAINKRFDAGTIAGSITGLLKTAAVTICIMLWFGSLISAYINQQAYAEIIVKKIMILAISGTLIANAPEICQWIMDIGAELANEAIEITATSADDRTEDIMNVLYDAQDQAYIDSYNETMGIKETKPSKDSTWIDGLFGILDWFKEAWAKAMARMTYSAGTPLTFALVFLIPMVCTAVAYVIVIITCYSRGVEMAILKVLSPIPMGLIANDPLGSGAGAKFLKNVAAVSLQGLILVVIPAIMGGVIAETLTGAVASLGSVRGHFGEMMKIGLEMSAIAVAEAVVMTRSLSFAQKALGLQ